MKSTINLALNEIRKTLGSITYQETDVTIIKQYLESLKEIVDLYIAADDLKGAEYLVKLVNDLEYASNFTVSYDLEIYFYDNCYAPIVEFVNGYEQRKILKNFKKSFNMILDAYLYFPNILEDAEPFLIELLGDIAKTAKSFEDISDISEKINLCISKNEKNKLLKELHLSMEAIKTSFSS